MALDWLSDLVIPKRELKKVVLKNFLVVDYQMYSIVDIVSGTERYRIYPKDFSGGIEDAIAKLKLLESSQTEIDIVVDVSQKVEGTCGAVIRVRELSSEDTIMQVKYITFQSKDAGKKKDD
jgi:hypothetical protein